MSMIDRESNNWTSSSNVETWEELYVLTNHWKSDLEFYRDDLSFLYHLVNKYFLWITKSENIDIVKELKNSLFGMKEKVKELLDTTEEHGVRLGYLVENPNYADHDFMKKEHAHLEEEIAQYVKSFRNNRKEVFKITEYIIDSEELANVMNN